MIIYSHSRLSAFEQCPLKFKFQYIDKLIPEIKQTIEGFLGSKIHETLEWVYNHCQKEKLQLDEIINYFIILWNKDFDSEIKIINESYTQEHYFNEGIKFLVNYFVRNSPFQDNTIATEKKIIIALDEDKEYIIQGYIDRLVHNKDTNIFEIHDYKTGNFMKSQEELDNDRQLALYSLGIKQNYENVADVHLIWHFLAFDKKIISKRTDEQIDNLKKEIIELINKIEHTREFTSNPSVLCKWCGFKKYCQGFN